jgi:hypothetical protein
LDGRSWALILVKTLIFGWTLIDAHFSKDAHGCSFLDGRLWTLILVRTLMDAHGRSWTLRRSWTILGRFSDAGRTLGGRKPDASRTILDDQGRSENLVTRRSRSRFRFIRNTVIFNFNFKKF